MCLKKYSMIYFSIDIETTGVNWNQDTILEFGAIMEDTEKQLPFESLPKFNALLRHPKYIGSPYALALHTDIFTELAKPEGKSSEKIILYNHLGIEFKSWLIKQGIDSSSKIVVAGKNFASFDMRFLENLEGFNSYIKFNQRFIDPAVFYFDSSVDKELPNLSLCKQRAGIQDTTIAHRTIKDAWDIISVLRGKMYPVINNEKFKTL